MPAGLHHVLNSDLDMLLTRDNDGNQTIYRLSLEHPTRQERESLPRCALLLASNGGAWCG